MKKLLFFGKSGDKTSFSRITKEIVSRLKDHFDVILLGSKDPQIDGIKFIKIGSDTETISYEEYTYNWKRIRPVSLEMNMKYALIQIADLFNKGIDIFIMCNAIFEVNYFNGLITTTFNKDLLKGIKRIIWTPIDYIPTYRIVKNIYNCHLLYTMTPIMADILKDFNEKRLKISNDAEIHSELVKIDDLGHGSDLLDIKETRSKAIKILNKSKIFYGKKLNENNIIILNANNCKNTNRKRLDITIDAFNIIKHKDPNLVLWLHTDLETLTKYNIEKTDRIIFSQIGISDYYLSLIYKVCQIGLQTSTGEGWSLTNCEHSMYNALQVVPDFLATGYHYKNNRGILIPVTLTNDKNEESLDIITGVVSVSDTADKLLQAIDIIKSGDHSYTDNAYNYFKELTWSSVANKLISTI